MKALKSFAIFLCLAGMVFVLVNMELMETIYKGYDSIFSKKATSAPSSVPPSATSFVPPSAPSTVPPSATPNPGDFCTFKPLLSSADAEEERLLLELAWPETPVLSSPLLLNQTSHAGHSFFHILPRKGGGEWHVGDQLEVMIKVCDFLGNAKKSGGDFLVASLHNKTLEAGVAGRVVDHSNGSYSAVFTLLWEGSAQVQVELIHSSTAITVLRRLNRENPDRLIFKSVFHSGSISETTVCNICLRQNKQPQCNFTDPRTGGPWFCYKPKNLSCDTRINHFKTAYRTPFKGNERMLFQRNANLKVLIPASGPSSVNVLPQIKGQPGLHQDSWKSGTSGYYYQGVWRSLDGIKFQQFNNASAISQCLKGKMVYLYGDSTIRQWFEYFTTSLPDVKEVNLKGVTHAGPFMMWDPDNQTMITFRIHGLPFHILMLPTSKESYIATELDAIDGGSDTVVVFGICAHFGAFPTELYIRRLQNIRMAVIRLLNRAPDTLVVIKTGTLTRLSPFFLTANINWFAAQANKIIRAMFKGINIKVVDAWDMVLAHYLEHDLHPSRPIIKNMVDVLLSYTCPHK
ncbi:NXPE family member 3-like [Cheilinus undulatus]|uniref:NXPE family member 3-like n=1 Tax=Cheilinus undulatus TaxID=241271 RepID=UPI001BD437BE|nr:NXPE family member 3-like [Cheilinus undulatus]